MEHRRFPEHFVRLALWIALLRLLAYTLFPNRKVYETCTRIVAECVIQVPKTPVPYHHWQRKRWGICSSRSNILRQQYIEYDCDQVLGFYEVSNLTVNDALPNLIMTEVLNDSEISSLHEQFTSLVEHLDANSVPWAVAWGTALAASRHGVLLTPWDDDLDMMAERRGIESLVQRLEELSEGDWCSAEFVQLKKCKVWRIKGDVIIHWKPTGVPYKVNMKGQIYPAIDINTFLYTVDLDGKRKQVTIPDAELLNGHTRKERGFARFQFPVESILSSRNDFLEHTVRLSLSNSQHVRVNLAFEQRTILRAIYGNDVYESCVTSHIHRPHCENAHDCIPLANWVKKYRFPCCKLPTQLRDGLVRIEAC